MQQAEGSKAVRFGIVGAGAIVGHHCRAIAEAEGAQLCAVSDLVRERAETVARDTGARTFCDHREMMDSGEVDAVIIATPHPSHPEIAVDAFERGLHVLCEKPLAAHVKAARIMVAASARSSVKFGVVFQLRTSPIFRKAKELIEAGEIGALRRAIWITTRSFRSQGYYDAADWRSTWEGEGGGLLLNQCPHELDLYQWLLGMPSRVRGFATFGRYHDIEVEDDVTAYMEWDKGMTGIFVATTGEVPGTNRLEIAGDCGRVVIEDDEIVLDRTAGSVTEFTRNSQNPFKGPECRKIEVAVSKERGRHGDVIRNFVAAILRDEPLAAPGEDAIHSLELANAMVLSSVQRQTVSIPIDADAYENFLHEAIRASRSK